MGSVRCSKGGLGCKKPLRRSSRLESQYVTNEQQTATVNTIIGFTVMVITFGDSLAPDICDLYSVLPKAQKEECDNRILYFKKARELIEFYELQETK